MRSVNLKRSSGGLRVWFVRVFALLAVLYMLLAVRTDFFGPDTPVYFSYTSSVVQDGDLNVVNEVVDDMRFGGPNAYVSPGSFFNVTSTRNYPDYHNHGGIVFWIPSYLAGTVLYNLWDRLGFFENTDKGFGTSSTADLGNRVWQGRDAGKTGYARGMMSFSTVVFCCLTLFGTFFLCRGFLSGWICVFSIFAVFWGTPYFYYVVGQPGNAQILSGFLAVISILWFKQAACMTRLQFFFYGIFFGMCAVVKIDLWFQVFFISSFFVYLLVCSKTTWAKGFAMFGGFAIPFALKLTNDALKYGCLRQGEFHLISSDFFYFFKQTFSSYRGFFYTSPVFYLCVAGALIVMFGALKARRKQGEFNQDHVFLLCLVFYFAMKVFLMSFRFAWGGGTPGARILISEFPLQVFLLGYFLKYLRFTLLRIFAIIICLGAVLWNMLVVAEFVAEVDLFNIAQVAPLAFRLKHLKELLFLVLLPKQLHLKLLLFTPPLLALFTLLYVLAKNGRRLLEPVFSDRDSTARKFIQKIFAAFALYMCVCYLGVTLVNLKNNRANIEELTRKGYFEYARVVKPSRYEDFENLGCFDEMIEFFTVRQNTREVQRLEKLKQDYLAS